MSMISDMTRKLFNLLITAFVLAGCAAEVVGTPETIGYLVVDLSQGEGLITKVSDEDMMEYDIVITGPDNLTCKCAELPSVLELEPGSYTISASSPGCEPAAFSQPIYASSTGFDIREGETTSVKLICTMQNVKVTVNPSAAFKAQVKSYSVTVDNGEGRLTWTQADVDEGKEGFFTVAPLFVSMRGLSQTGVSLSYDGIIRDVEATDHHIISFDSL